MSITFSSCFYIIKSKFEPSVYIEWMTNFLSIVNQFNLVIYTDENSFPYIPKVDDHSKIKIVIKPLHEFYNYKYKDYWIQNHEKNVLLNKRICWEVNMLWSEKIAFVHETIQKQYFETDFYGWCDIGYFRNRMCDTHTHFLGNWPNPDTIMKLQNDKVHYSFINNDSSYMNQLFRIINDKNELGLPREPIPADQCSVAGGFFILHKNLIDWWCKTYDAKLELYFKNGYLVKDDQIVLIDCIFSNIISFQLYKENLMGYDNWFMFQRLLN